MLFSPSCSGILAQIPLLQFNLLLPTCTTHLYPPGRESAERCLILSDLGELSLSSDTCTFKRTVHLQLWRIGDGFQMSIHLQGAHIDRSTPPACNQGRCPSLMLTTPSWQLTSRTSGSKQQPHVHKLGRAHPPTCTCNPTRRCTRWEIYAGVSRRSPTSRVEALSLFFSRHPQDRVLHRHVE